MTLATLTWTKTPILWLDSGSQTLVGLINMIESCITNHSQWWQVNHTNASPRWVEIKRKGSPSVDMAPVRILIFGGTTPNAAALEGIHTATTTYLYVSLAPTANTGAGGPADYSAGDPYAGSLSVKGLSVVGGNNPSVATGASVWLCESEDGICIQLRTAPGTVAYPIIAGRLIDSAGTGYWLLSVTGGATGFASYPTGNTALFPIAGCVAPASNQPISIGIFGSFKYEIGRCFDGLNCINGISGASSLGSASSSVAVLHTLLLASRARGTSNNWEYVGKLRQIRIGPSLIDRSDTYSGAAHQTIFVGSNTSAITAGLHFDDIA